MKPCPKPTRKNPKREKKSPKPSRMSTWNTLTFAIKADMQYAAQVSPYVGWFSRLDCDNRTSERSHAGSETRQIGTLSRRTESA